jgi:hypothetical protein
MKSLISLVLIVFICNSAFAQKNVTADTTLKKNLKNTVVENNTDKKDQVTQVVHITPGSSGVKRSIGYKFSFLNEDGDPGNGIFRYDNRSISGIAAVFVDNIDISGEDRTKWYSTWDDTTGATGRGRITVADTTGKVVTVLNITGVLTDKNGFWKIPVEYVSGELPADGSVYYYVFERIEHGAADKPNQITEIKEEKKVNKEVQAVEGKEEKQKEQKVEEVVVKEEKQKEQKVEEVEVKEEKQKEQKVEEVVVKEEKQKEQKVEEVEVKEEKQKEQKIEEVVVKEEKQKEQKVEEVVVKEEKKLEQEIPVIEVSKPRQETKVTQLPQRVTVPQPGQRRQAVQVTQTNPVPKPEQQNKVTMPVQVVQMPQTNTVPKPDQQTQVTKPAQTVQVPQTKPVQQTNQRTQVSQPAQNFQNNQQVTVNQPRPATQYNQFPVVPNNFQTQSGGHRRWYRGIIEIGYAFGLGDYGIDNFRFNFINGVRLGQFASVGLGIGYRRYFTENLTDPYLVSGKNQIPVFLDFRTNFSSKKLTPYLALGIGNSAGYNSSETRQEGLLFNASGGIWYNVSSRFAVFAGFGFEMQKLEFSDTDPFTGNYKKNANSLGINIGISF